MRPTSWVTSVRRLGVPTVGVPCLWHILQRTGNPAPASYCFKYWMLREMDDMGLEAVCTITNACL